MHCPFHEVMITILSSCRCTPKTPQFEGYTILKEHETRWCLLLKKSTVKILYLIIHIYLSQTFLGEAVPNSIHSHWQLGSWLSEPLLMWVKFSQRMHGGWGYEACKRLRPISPNTRGHLSFATNPATCRMPTTNNQWRQPDNWLQPKHVDHIQYRKTQNTPGTQTRRTKLFRKHNVTTAANQSSWPKKFHILNLEESPHGYPGRASDATRQFPVFSPCI